MSSLQESIANAVEDIRAMEHINELAISALVDFVLDRSPGMSREARVASLVLAVRKFPPEFLPLMWAVLAEKVVAGRLDS